MGSLAEKGRMRKPNKMTTQGTIKLIVSLPENNLRMAKSAEDAGANAIKLHLNVRHDASGTFFGSWAEERKAIEAIRKSVLCEIGVMPGADKLPTSQEFREISETGVTFIDIYAHHVTPPLLATDTAFNLILALKRELPAKSILEMLSALEKTRLRPEMIEASYVDVASYGSRLTLADIGDYLAFAEDSPLPILIPTQKLIEPEDLKLLKHKKVGGIMIGVIATGRSAKSIFHVTSRFRKAIDAL